MDRSVVDNQDFDMSPINQSNQLQRSKSVSNTLEFENIQGLR